jgi:hypothetical protein
MTNGHIIIIAREGTLPLFETIYWGIKREVGAVAMLTIVERCQHLPAPSPPPPNLTGVQILLEVKVEVEMVYRIKTSIPVVSFFCESWRI